MFAFTPSRMTHVAFYLWIAGGIGWVIATWYVWDRFVFWFPNEHTQQTLLFVTPTPEQQARMSADERRLVEEGLARHHFRARLVLAGDCLTFGSFIYGAVGAMLFRRWGCSVIAIAVAISFTSYLAFLEVNLW